MNKALLVFSTLAILAISGCVQESVTPTGNGMAFTDFSASLDSVQGGNKTAAIYMEVENRGGTAIKHAMGCLIGSNFNGSYGQGLWEISTGKLCQNNTKNLTQFDPVNNIPGGALKPRWYLKSPCLAETLTRTDTFTGRVFYDYDTTASTSAWVYTATELTAAKQRGESIPSSLVVDSTTGPVAISLEAVQPVRAEDGSFTLKITISNVGEGVVFDSSVIPDWKATDTMPNIAEEKINTFSAVITLPSGVTSTECSSELTNIELRKGQSVTKSCDITIPAVTAKKSYPITVKASYGYYIDDTLSITASGKKNDLACK